MASGAYKISDLHKGAFWIYGVTAMVMHDPVAHVLLHMTSAGILHWEVTLEVWRTMLLLALMGKFFLESGWYFDEVYLRETSGAAYPRKSYALDFLLGLTQFLLFLGGAVSVANHGRFAGEVSPFSFLVAGVFLFHNAWYAVSAAAGFSAAGKLRESRNHDNVTFLCTAAVLAGARKLLGQDAVMAEQLAFIPLGGFVCRDLYLLIRKYNSGASA